MTAYVRFSRISLFIERRNVQTNAVEDTEVNIFPQYIFSVTLLVFETAQ
jgi:hypothetical protein